jgi:hypothetical protein
MVTAATHRGFAKALVIGAAGDRTASGDQTLS